MTRSALDSASDEVLADRAADGDVRAFTVLVTRYQRLVRAYAARVLGGTAQSDDVAQEAFITAWAQLPTLSDRAAVRAWLLRITTRKALDALRARRDHGDVDDLEVADTGAGPAQRAQTASMSSALAAALRTLPADQRQAWVLRELGGYSYDEIALELDLPQSTVRGLLSRARTRLLTDMNDWR